jgi:hypothetical protein
MFLRVLCMFVLCIDEDAIALWLAASEAALLPD